MNKLLTIVIPTFNRAILLKQQLTWLAKAIKGFESECEIIISDNCSTDIPEIYAKLLKIGYSKTFCLQMILPKIIKTSDWKIFLGALRRWPFLAINIIVSYLALVSVFTWDLLFLTPEVKSTQ